MNNITHILMLLLICNVDLFGQQKKYPQPLVNDICTKIIIGNFTCKGCASSDKDLPDDVREDVIETLNNFKYCTLLSREKLSEIIKVGEEEVSIGSLNAQQRTQLKEYYQAERIMFGNLKIQSNGSVLVTLEIDNLATADQEGYKRFTIPADKFGDYDNRHPIVEQGIVGMLLGKTDAKKPVVALDSLEENTGAAAKINISVKDGLVAFYPFNGNANDESGHGNHGIVSGAKLTNDRNRNANAAYSFNGSTDFIMIKNSPSICPTYFTISLWAFLSNTPSNNYLRLLSKHLNQGGSYGSYQLLTGTLEAPLKCIGTAITNTGYVVSESNSNTTKGWHNLMLTWNGQSLNLYIDKALVRRETWAGNIVYDSNPLYIGKDGFYSVSYFSGAIDDVRIYNRVLNEDEMMSVFEDK